MHTLCTRSFRGGLLVLTALLLAPPARGETRAAESLAFGWLVEHADAVVVATLVAEEEAETPNFRRLRLEVEEGVRGPLARGDMAVVEVASGPHAPRFVVGATHLAFLRAAAPKDEGDPGWALLSGSFGMRPVPATDVASRFPALCRAIAAAMGDSDRYRALLVDGIEDVDPGIAWSAATDLVRHVEMHDALTAGERTRIVAAFERQAVGKDTKKALALAAAVAGTPDAAAALVRSLEDPRAREIRIEVGVALRGFRGTDAVAVLVQALERAEEETAANLLNVLGTMAPASSVAVDAARGRLQDPRREVRLEAAHAFGLVVRALQRESPLTRIAGREGLLALLARAETDAEQRAAVWALAQIDEPEAYEALRQLAREDERDLVREAAARYLANPRLALVLR